MMFGQLKSLNNPMATAVSQDPGQDSYSSGPHASVKADVFGYTLDYYNDDYIRSGSPIKAYNSSSYTGQNVSYAGLVKAMRWKTTLPSGVTDDYSGAARMYEYNYNDLYQFSGATFGTAAISSGNVAFTATSDYGLSGLTYDDNGNMKALQRYKKAVSGTASLLDDLSYNYHSTKTNRLLQVQDAASTSGIAADMDLPNQSSSSNYSYNAIGELTANAQEDQGFEYNASGLCTRAYAISTGYNLATFTYNDKGMRHSKTSYNTSGTAVKTTWYVYDAGGAQVATYEKDLTVTGSSPAVKDFMVYAAGRMGIYDAAGSKIYFELSDHLGNTRAIVTETSGSAEVVSFTDYYPHGGVMPGQNYASSLAYRYGYQGQEKDPETGLVNFELRQYDARLGRWYNPDPMGQHHSPYLAMGNNPISSVDPTGGQDGSKDGAMISSWGKYTAPSVDPYFTMGNYDRTWNLAYGNGGNWLNNSDRRANYSTDMHRRNELKSRYIEVGVREHGAEQNGHEIIDREFDGYYGKLEDGTTESISANDVQLFFNRPSAVSIPATAFASHSSAFGAGPKWGNKISSTITFSSQKQRLFEPIETTWGDYYEMTYNFSQVSGQQSAVNINTTKEQGRSDLSQDISVNQGFFRFNLKSNGDLTQSIGLGSYRVGFNLSKEMIMNTSVSYKGSTGSGINTNFAFRPGGGTVVGVAGVAVTVLGLIFLPEVTIPALRAAKTALQQGVKLAY